MRACITRPHPTSAANRLPLPSSGILQAFIKSSSARNALIQINHYLRLMANIWLNNCFSKRTFPLPLTEEISAWAGPEITSQDFPVHTSLLNGTFQKDVIQHFWIDRMPHINVKEGKEVSFSHHLQLVNREKVQDCSNKSRKSLFKMIIWREKKTLIEDQFEYI